VTVAIPWYGQVSEHVGAGVGIGVGALVNGVVQYALLASPTLLMLLLHAQLAGVQEHAPPSLEQEHVKGSACAKKLT